MAALTLGFASGAASLGRSTLPRLPTRVATIAGAGAVALLLVTILVVGGPLGTTGSIIVAVASGVLAAGVSIGAWRARVTRLSAAAQ